MKKQSAFIYVIIFIFFLFILPGCDSFNQGNVQKVGMLVENTVNDQAWGSSGYEGLLAIKEEFDVDVYFKEEIQTQQEVNQAVEEFANKGVNLIFGHSNTYGKMFDTISSFYPDIHFVYFNGGYENSNLTSLNFNAHAMGFFGGMVAGEMTKTNQVGIIAAYEWQPEIEGFFEGVSYQNPQASVHMNFVNNWDDEERALDLFDQMNAQNVDVFYPAGDTFSVSVINKVKELDKYAIGYVTDQSHLSERKVLTSTVQHVDQLYLLAAEKFDDDELNGGIFTYDFQDEVISLGKFSPDIPNRFREEINEKVEKYMETDLLPNER
ncbi:BMP family ABC transporter substrate-binding protein [Aquibacillus saliphilus]|uniref:BMP family ABC transporter substrate-binding protein n=1 Tax=Aquibacillus saliphilus TaxID=1909422 RepID=UPI001CF0741C|nr:BMP family ABC transporter substrate-binding protein [Aquibacillus saliphilus]